MSAIPPTMNKGASESGGLYVYKWGLLCCSVCAPASMEPIDVEIHANRALECGTESGWTISKDATFSGGEPNPSPCNDDPEGRRHWLLDA